MLSQLCCAPQIQTGAVKSAESRAAAQGVIVFKSARAFGDVSATAAGKKATTMENFARKPMPRATPSPHQAGR